MQSPLQSHISFLEARIETLSAQLAQPWRTQAERERLESLIHLAEMALTHYRKAYEMEQAIREVDSD